MNVVAFGVFFTTAVVSSVRNRQRRHATSKIGESQKVAMEQLLSTTNQRVYKFVLTGGPCSGKTTALERLQVFLRERGFRVLVAPEVATMGLTNGACVDDFARSESAFAFQQFVISSQLTLEDSLVAYAKTLLVDAVVLCDRGVMDGSAYVDGETWQKVLDYANKDIVSVREGRYDAVFHLVTAAQGAERFYTLENNQARSETPEQARQVDERLVASWLGHPRHYIIDNANKTFERKMQELVGLVAQTVGLPVLTRKTHKFVFQQSPFGQIHLLPNVQVFEVEKVMLKVPEVDADSAPTASSLTDSPGSPSGRDSERVELSERSDGSGWVEASRKEDAGRILYSFVRKRSCGGFAAYGLTTVKQLESGQRVELKQVITHRMYSMLVGGSADSGRMTVRQRRYCFLWKQQSMYLQEYLSPVGLWTLQCQSESAPDLPPALEVVGCKAVAAEDERVSSYALSCRTNGGKVGRAGV